MLGSRWVQAGLATVVVAVGSTGVRAQDVVPGGWSAQVGFQSFGGPELSGGAGDMAAGMRANVGFLNVNGFGVLPPLPPGPFGRQGQVQPQVVNGLVPLADAVRKHSRRRPRR